MKNYNKTDVLIKDKKYTKKFSIFNFKEPSFKWFYVNIFF